MLLESADSTERFDTALFRTRGGRSSNPDNFRQAAVLG